MVSTQGTGRHRRATFRVRGALRCQLNMRDVQTCCRDVVFRASSLTSAIVGWVAVDWHTRSCLPPRDALTRFTHSTHKRIDPPSVEVEGPDIPEAPWCLNAATPNKWKVLVLNTEHLRAYRLSTPRIVPPNGIGLDFIYCAPPCSSAARHDAFAMRVAATRIRSQ